MMLPTLATEPLQLAKALRRIKQREREAILRADRVGFFTRLFRPRKTHVMTARAVRLGEKETVLSNL